MAARKPKASKSSNPVPRSDAGSANKQRPVRAKRSPRPKPLATIEAHGSHDSYVVTDSKGIIRLADGSATHLLNLSHQALMGQHLPALLAPDDHGAIEAQLRRLEDEPGLEWNMTLAPKGTGRFSALLTISAVRKPSGEIAAVHWLIRDRSSRQRSAAGDQLLQAVGEHVLKGSSLTQILSHLCERLIQLLPHPFVYIATREAGEIVLCAQAGDARLAPDQPSHAFTAEERRMVESVLETHATLHLQEESEHGDGSSSYPARLLLPLGTEPRTLGVLVVYSAQPRAFDPVTIQWFEKLARQMTIYLLLSEDFDQLRVPVAAIATAEHPVFITDADGRIEWVNDAYTRLTGYTAADLIGTIPHSLKAGKFRSRLRQAHRLQAQGQCWRYELVEQRKDGRSYMVEQVVTPLRNDLGQVTHFVAIHQDITVRKETEARIFHLAHHDPLTDLPNRTMFFDRLKQALGQARRHGRSVGVLFIDLDRFKPINDSLGHEMGDELLKNVANRLTQCVRATDTVARLSGDEFTIILQDLDRGQDAGHVAHKVLEAVAQPMTVGSQTLHATASVGIALYPFDATDPDLLLVHADRAMYRAKEKGGHCYQFVSDEMNAQAFERLMLEKSLISAWERGDFFLHYQPEIDMRSGRIIGVEALLRWQHPELGLVFPSQLLPLVEDGDRFDAIQEWVLQTACRQSRAWSTQGLPSVPMSVNFSCKRADPKQVLTMVERVLQETGLAPQALRLEISQSGARLHQRAVGSIVKQLLEMEVGSVLDDTVYEDTLSSLLQRVPFQRLKLAASLVFAAPGNPDSMRAIDQCLTIGRKLQVPVLAKGVESTAQVKFLREHGCHEMQGYLCSRPLPGEEMTTLLDEQGAVEL